MSSHDDRRVRTSALSASLRQPASTLQQAVEEPNAYPSHTTAASSIPARDGGAHAPRRSMDEHSDASYTGATHRSSIHSHQSIPHSYNRSQARGTGGLFGFSPGNYATSYGASPMGYLINSRVAPVAIHNSAPHHEAVPPPPAARSPSLSGDGPLHLAVAIGSGSASQQPVLLHVGSPDLYPPSRQSSGTPSLTAPLLDKCSEEEDEATHSLRCSLESAALVPTERHARREAAPMPPPPPNDGGGDGGRLKAFVFGMINTAVGLPALIAFAAIVFKAPLYGPYLGSLCKFFFFSSGIHQLVFVAGSSLPFAIGQVQDVGLIFMSAMATDIADLSVAANLSAEVALGTTLVTLALSTLIVGVLTFLVGKYKLAGLVQYVPLPVVGGYLGYVGYFCLASGIALGAGVDVGSLRSWANLVAGDPAIKSVPTLATTFIFMQTMEHFTHPLALPAVLLAVPALFHAVLWGAGYTLADAQGAEWVMKPTEGGELFFWQLWSLYNIHDLSFGGINFGFMLQQVPKLAGLFLVVCFGSCMDVAAIQQDLTYALDFNRELCTVGISNIVTAVVGAGYTGSYIFSQTIFTMRAGVRSRVAGMTVALMELVFFALPFNVVQYMPNFFFGALLVWFGIEISRDWLILSCRKLSRAEYVLLWLTFTCIMQWGLEGGIAIGIVLATLYFAYRYAQSQISSLRLLPITGVAQHQYSTDVVLDALMSSRVIAVALSGYIFFGSATSISDRVEELVNAMLASCDGGGDGARAAGGEFPDGTARLEKGKLEQLASVLQEAPTFLVLDCGGVTWLDATGARTFGSLTAQLSARGVTPIFTNVRSKEARTLLAAHGVPLQRAGDSQVPAPTPRAEPDTSIVVDVEVGGAPLQAGHFWEYSSCQAAMRHVQSVLLALAVDQGLVPPPQSVVKLEDMLQHQLQEVALGTAPDVRGVAAALGRAMTVRVVGRGDKVFTAGQAADELFLIESGMLRLSATRSAGAEAAKAAGLDGASGGDGTADSLGSTEAGPGCLVGAVDFYLQRPASCTATCVSGSCRLLSLSRPGFQGLLTTAPSALNLLQVILMRATCLELSGSLETLALLEGDSST